MLRSCSWIDSWTSFPEPHFGVGESQPESVPFFFSALGVGWGPGNLSSYVNNPIKPGRENLELDLKFEGFLRKGLPFELSFGNFPPLPFISPFSSFPPPLAAPSRRAAAPAPPTPEPSNLELCKLPHGSDNSCRVEKQSPLRIWSIFAKLRPAAKNVTFQICLDETLSSCNFSHGKTGRSAKRRVSLLDKRP